MSDIEKKPRVGGPAKGKGQGTGHGGPAAGPGWGGPARGAGNGNAEAPQLEFGHTLSRGPHDMSKSQRLKALNDMLFHLAMNAEQEMARIRACEACLDRMEGKPLQRNLIAHASDAAMMDDAMLAAIAMGDGGDEPETEH